MAADNNSISMGSNSSSRGSSSSMGLGFLENDILKISWDFQSFPMIFKDFQGYSHGIPE